MKYRLGDIVGIYCPNGSKPQEKYWNKILTTLPDSIGAKYILKVKNCRVVHNKRPKDLFSYIYNKTQGHRFLSSGMSLINDAADYKNQLEKLNVMVDFEERRESIISQVKMLEHEFSFEVNLDSKLLTEVTNLVENPNIIYCQFV